MNYCHITTTNHPLALNNKSCLERIHYIVLREGGNNSPFKKQHIGLNLDNIERNAKRAQLRSTMDFCFGISTDNLRNKQIVLTELKLSVVNPRNIGKNELVDKVNGSVAILTRCETIYPEHYFIFRDNLKEQARRHFQSLFTNKPRIPYQPIKLDELHAKFFV
jgi:hypothetical protein